MDKTKKQCFKCGEIKPLSAFYAHPQMKDGHLNKCKECTKKDVSSNYRKNINHYKNYEHSEKRLESRHRRSKEQLKRYRENHKEENKARRIVAYNLAKGYIVKPSKCEICGKECNPDAHHENYSRPLEVKWICRQCHCKIHNNQNIPF